MREGKGLEFFVEGNKVAQEKNFAGIEVSGDLGGRWGAARLSKKLPYEGLQ